VLLLVCGEKRVQEGRGGGGGGGGGARGGWVLAMELSWEELSWEELMVGEGRRYCTGTANKPNTHREGRGGKGKAGFSWPGRGS
jgi:hypothetical protein